MPIIISTNTAGAVLVCVRVCVCLCVQLYSIDCHVFQEREIMKEIMDNGPVQGKQTDIDRLPSPSAPLPTPRCH